ncbi:hypothetical protein IMZ48_13305, partial [Candidatus Bathyarchaeota archaeon]|nr:hypothetical protein [Candidatus Bathyarchaeota archaeon]
MPGKRYWDEHRDAGNFKESDIFDADTGFGSAATGFDMIKDGPFANASTPIGPGFEITDNYLNRNINDTVSMWAVREKVDDCMIYDKYEDVWACLYMVPHRGGHGGFGGTVSVSHPDFV